MEFLKITISLLALLVASISAYGEDYIQDNEDAPEIRSTGSGLVYVRKGSNSGALYHDNIMKKNMYSMNGLPSFQHPMLRPIARIRMKTGSHSPYYTSQESGYDPRQNELTPPIMNRHHVPPRFRGETDDHYGNYLYSKHVFRSN